MDGPQQTPVQLKARRTSFSDRSRLRKDRLVRTCRGGKTICYSLNGQEAPVLLETLDRLFCVVDADTAAASPIADNGELSKPGRSTSM